jgi:uncharacterized protein with ParB-like and HNH nuclease domain
MANSKYEVVSQTIEGLLSLGTAQFEVPPFQRTYSWGADEINQLIDDVFGESSDGESPGQCLESCGLGFSAVSRASIVR